MEEDGAAIHGHREKGKMIISIRYLSNYSFVLLRLYICPYTQIKTLQANLSYSISIILVTGSCFPIGVRQQFIRIPLLRTSQCSHLDPFVA
jgi:hypothetical protein